MKIFLFFSALILALCAATDVEAKAKKYKNGNLYEGEIVKGLPSGAGVMVYTNGDKYSGKWIEGKPSSGVMIYANGDKYIGPWSGGLRSGIGKMTYANRDEYNGSWSDGLRSGVGQMKYKDGTIYKCSWVDGKVDESSEVYITYPNSHRYKGRVKNGLRDGQGRYQYSASTSSGYKDGIWQEDEFISGKVILVKDYDTNIPSHIKEVRGNYANGVRTGVIEYIDKSKYSGDIKDYKRHGQGALSAGESKIEGEWLSDQVVHATGSVRYKSRGYDIAISSNDEERVAVRYIDEKQEYIDLNLDLLELPKWGEYIAEALAAKSAQIKEDLAVKSAQIKEAERKKAEAIKQQRIKQAKVDSKYYVWKDSELASIDKSNPAKLSAMIGWKKLIIQGAVRDIRKLTETKFDIIYDTYQHTYYIIQLDGIALRCDDGNAVAMLSIGKNIYTDAYYTNDTFFTDKYPLFRGSIYSSLDGAVDEVLASRSNQLDGYIRCPYRK